MTSDEVEFLFPSRIAESLSRIGVWLVWRAARCDEDEHRCQDDESDWFDGNDAA